MLLGLRTFVIQVPDLAAAKAWYSEALGLKPYFDMPYYVGFEVAGYEFGLQPLEGEAKPLGCRSVAYWGVADVAAEVARLVECGATVVEQTLNVGGDIVVASVADPFGNVLGLIFNPHFAAKG